MKSKTLVILFMLGFSATIRGAALVVDAGPVISVSEETLEKLEKVDLTASPDEWLAALLAISPNGCPTIYSSWYCGLLKRQGEDVKADLELRMRAFGGHLLLSIKTQASSLSAQKLSASTGIHTVETLLDLADWAAKGDGLGNGEIASRARALAGVSLAYVIVDRNAPLEPLTRDLVARIMAGGELSWFEFVIRAHEHEVPGSVAPYVQVPGNGEEPSRALMTGALRASSLIQNILSSKGKNGVEPVGADLREELPPELAIYIGDGTADFSKKSTDLWNSYMYLPNSQHWRIAKDLQTTGLFLEKIGSFPGIPSIDQIDQADRRQLASGFYRSLTDVAFANAWVKFSDQKQFVSSNLKTDPRTGLLYIDRNSKNLSVAYRNLHAGIAAASVYDAVKTGRWNNYLNNFAPPPPTTGTQ